MRSNITGVVRATLAVLLTWGPTLAHAAISLNGEQAVEPASAASTDIPAPIANIDTYQTDQHDCPLPCEDYANEHSWIPYHKVSRLSRCGRPMLLQLGAVNQPLDDPLSTVLIRSCTLGVAAQGAARLLARDQEPPMENPKRSPSLFETSLDTAPACSANGTLVDDKLSIALSDNGGGSSEQLLGLLAGVETFFKTQDNCDENFLFAYHNKTVAGVYIGPNLGKSTAVSAVAALSKSIKAASQAPARTVVQLCGSNRPAEQVMGISIASDQDLASVQKTAVAWSSGTCDSSLQSADTLQGVQVFSISGASNGTNSTTALSNSTTSRRASRLRSYLPLLRRKDRFPSNPNTHTHMRRADPPKPDKDGICATRLIVDGDTCGDLAKTFGITVVDIERWNRGKTWGWAGCREMLKGYNMCLSDGLAPMPPPQKGAECGPLVENTTRPLDPNFKMEDLNPCPLKACCSNWGFCGVFPGHCEEHKPENGGPGSKEKGYPNSCVSNCGNEIKQNSGPPEQFGRVGYYSAFNKNRKCLWLKAKNANTDGTYTHIHWGFGAIDPNGWKPYIEDGKDEWEDFKALTGVKKILSLGGWTYSTEPATYNIIRRAILENRDEFSTNLAVFVLDHGLDGIDIDWEYPGAPDIMVGGEPIGKKGDGVEYLKFLTVLKSKMPDKTVSICAPASYWYLKAFPIDRIMKVIDYVVYMTYDLHGQWDYGNPNSFDQCDSGKCIRSHVNLTETRNALSMITKAGVPNNRVYIGESSYGRSFHMAQDGCWTAMCEFTGSRTTSDAKPGRCTNTGGYLANAEINELVTSGKGRTFFDDETNADVMLYEGDYVSFMSEGTKDSRRNDWKGLNFAGSIDWALDLQSFGDDDMNAEPERPEDGSGCAYGEDITLDSGDLCEFSCSFGFCPETLCYCLDTGPLKDLPGEVVKREIKAVNELHVDLNRLCKFACKYGHCPSDVCFEEPPEEPDVDVITVDDPSYYDTEAIRRSNSDNCLIEKGAPHDPKRCYDFCKEEFEMAKSEGRTSNYGCVGHWPGQKSIPWVEEMGTGALVAGGKCVCDNMILNEIADFIMEALPMIAAIGCFIIMSSLKLVLELGLQFVPGVGKALSAGLDAALIATEMVKHVYADDEDPAGAFEWWLSPCGATDLVPEEIRKVFDMLSTIPGRSSYKEPKNIKKHSGKKGDNGNPRAANRPATGRPPAKNNNPSKVNKKQCKPHPPKRMGPGKNTIREQKCQGTTTTHVELIITTVVYAQAARTMTITGTCDNNQWPQACWHYESALLVNPAWSTLSCPPGAATTANDRNRLNGGGATAVWAAQHKGAGWKDASNRAWPATCDMDEYPPAYLLENAHTAWAQAGINTRGQLMRFNPDSHNRGAGGLWKGQCFIPPLTELSDSDVSRLANRGPAAPPSTKGKTLTAQKTFAAITVTQRPEFSMTFIGPAMPPDAGLAQNPCWPSNLAKQDPGYAVLNYDGYYANNPDPARKKPQWDYAMAYSKGSNGD